MHLAMTSAAVHWYWFTAHLYGEQVSTGVNAVTQACCEPVLQSSTEQWLMRFALTSSAVDESWFTAHLHEEQNSRGVIAVTQACCAPRILARPGLLRSTALCTWQG